MFLPPLSSHLHAALAHVYPRARVSSRVVVVVSLTLFLRPYIYPTLFSSHDRLRDPLYPSYRLAALPSLSLSLSRKAQTKETESRLQTGVALIKLLKRTCI